MIVIFSYSLYWFKFFLKLLNLEFLSSISCFIFLLLSIIESCSFFNSSIFFIFSDFLFSSSVFIFSNSFFILFLCSFSSFKFLYIPFKLFKINSLLSICNWVMDISLSNLISVSSFLSLSSFISKFCFNINESKLMFSFAYLFINFSFSFLELMHSVIILFWASISLFWRNKEILTLLYLSEFIFFSWFIKFISFSIISIFELIVLISSDNFFKSSSFSFLFWFIGNLFDAFSLFFSIRFILRLAK